METKNSRKSSSAKCMVYAFSANTKILSVPASAIFWTGFSENSSSNSFILKPIKHCPVKCLSWKSASIFFYTLPKIFQKVAVIHDWISGKKSRHNDATWLWYPNRLIQHTLLFRFLKKTIHWPQNKHCIKAVIRKEALVLRVTLIRSDILQAGCVSPYKWWKH